MSQYMFMFRKKNIIRLRYKGIGNLFMFCFERFDIRCDGESICLYFQ